MKVEIKVEVEIELIDGDEPAKGSALHTRMVTSAVEAVQGALSFAQGEGFVHPMEDETSVEVKRVILERPRIPGGPRDWSPNKK